MYQIKVSNNKNKITFDNLIIFWLYKINLNNHSDRESYISD